MSLIRLALALLALALAPALRAEDAGRLLQYERIAAAGLPDQRLTIWLPPGYDAGARRYPVLYMHDGHNLFDRRWSNFDKIWAADKAMLQAVASGAVEPHIIIGIWAPGADRFRQYLPRDIHDAASPGLRAKMDAAAGGPILSHAYLTWIAGPLKTWVDTRFRTRPGRDDTAIMGSSMGGLMSCYAFLHRPDIFGRAACISSHWPAIDPRAVEGGDPELIRLWDRWFAEKLGAPDGRRLWLDHGTATLDAFYAPYQQAVDARIAASGWQKGKDWESRVYEGAEHEENAWAARLPEIMGWVLRRD
ncbi:putative alpha/beta superfamily hydrolase [Blastomonas natatoria]|uniref:Putative alpha/beta superfamily hydrolase n=1 Tax=Blastomonas natatoria TaxID=34015 RepID=A0A2V3URW6_9SPHN|nr:alpha/beta hydrolase-fold protein [Blastomonas natatoria]PXW70101.1 putative alpha/beta superfamily hydrolase [Blastomonas natatoria]